MQSLSHGSEMEIKRYFAFISFQDIQSGNVITDEAFEKLKNCLCGLVSPVSTCIVIITPPGHYWTGPPY